MPSSHPSTRVMFAVFAAPAAAFSVLQPLVNPVLPTIQHELHTTPATVTWVLTAYLLSASVATPLLGRVGDIAGKARTLLLVPSGRRRRSWLRAPATAEAR